jgi:hypothetical protein
MGLSTSGIVFISFAWGCIITLVTYCFIKVLRSERDEKKSK